MRKSIVAVGIIVLIISSLLIVSILLGMSIPPGYLSVTPLWLFFEGIVLILWGIAAKQSK